MPDSADRRRAIKERHRQAILDAAEALMEEIGGHTFSVDTLAERAGVSRRTIFNHFASLDDIVAEVAASILSDLIDSFAAADTAAGNGTLLDELIEVTTSIDLVTPMSRLARMLGVTREQIESFDIDAQFFSRAVEQVAFALVGVMSQRHPSADPMDVELCAGTFMATVTVANKHWTQRTGAVDTPASRAEWDRCFGHAIEALRTNFPLHSASPASPAPASSPTPTSSHTPPPSPTPTSKDAHHG